MMSMDMLGRKKGNAMPEKDWEKMSDEEKERVRSSEQEKFTQMQPISINEDFVEEEDGKAARSAAIQYWKKKYPHGITKNTIVGNVIINAKCIKQSLSHGFGRRKLAAIPTLANGMENAAYICTLADFEADNVKNHFFLYKLSYKSEENYVVCRVREQFDEMRLYIHEVAPISTFTQQKSDSLLSQPAGNSHLQLRGIALFKHIVSDFLQGVNGSFYPEKKEEKEMAVSNSSMYHQEIADSLTVAEESLHEEAAKQLHSAVKNLHVSMEKVEEAEQTCGADQETWDGYATRHENIVRRIEAAGDARSEGKSDEECSRALHDAQESMREGAAYMQERCELILQREKEYQEQIEGLRQRIEELERERELKAQSPEELARCIAVSTEFLAAIDAMRKEAKNQPRIVASEMFAASRESVKEAYYSVKLAPTKVKSYLKQKAHKAIDGVLHSVAGVFDKGITALTQRRDEILKKSHEVQSATEFYRDAMKQETEDGKVQGTMETERRVASRMAKAGFGVYAIEKTLHAESPHRKEMEKGGARNIAKDSVREREEQREEKSR